MCLWGFFQVFFLFFLNSKMCHYNKILKCIHLSVMVIFIIGDISSGAKSCGISYQYFFFCFVFSKLYFMRCAPYEVKDKDLLGAFIQYICIAAFSCNWG